MQKYIGLFLLPLLFFGCKVYHTSLSEIEHHPVTKKLDGITCSVKLLPANLAPQSKSAQQWIYDGEQVVTSYIFNELNTNYINRTPETHNGSIEVSGNIVVLGQGLGLWYVHPVMWVALLFGSPVSVYWYQLELTFLIKDKNGNIVNAYNYNRDSRKPMYLGLPYGTTYRRAVLDACKSIFEEFRLDYEKDLEYNIASILTPKSKSVLEKLKLAYVTVAVPKVENDKKNKYNKDRIIFINGEKMGPIRCGEYITYSVPHGKCLLSIKPAKAGNKPQEMSVTINVSSGKHYNFIDNRTFKHKSWYAPESFDYASDAEIKGCLDKGTLTNYLSMDASYTKYIEPKTLITQSPSTATEKSQKSYQRSNIRQEKKVKQNVNSSDIDVNIPDLYPNMNTNTYVLIFVNENYKFLDEVNFAIHDGQIFKEYCKKTLGIPEQQIFYYENAKFGNLSDGISKMKYVLDNFVGSEAIVYYSGHGISDEKTGDAYLIPVDGKGTNMVTCYSLEKMYKELANTQAKSITYFLDACFTGASKDGNMLVAARGTAREPEKIKLSGKTIVFSASSGDETAMTLESQGHGLFTYYLLKKLQETKGNTTYGELSDYIKKNVQKDAFLINEQPQTPVVATSPEIVDTWKNITLIHNLTLIEE